MRKATLLAVRGPLNDARVQVVFLVALAFLLRLAFLHVSGWYGQIVNNDAQEYLAIADSLRGGLGFAFVDGTPTAFRPFGYPVLLAGFQSLVGESVAGLHLLNALVGAALVAPTYALAKLIWKARTAVLAGLGVALHPVLIYLTAVISPDMMAILASMVLLWSTYRVVDKGQWRSATAIVGVFAGAISVLMRPETLLILWLLPLLLALQRGARGSGVRTVGAIALLGTVLALIPPAVRNWQRFEQVLPLPTIGGVTFWGANNAAANGGWILPLSDNWPDNDPPASMRGWAGLSESESQGRFYRYAFRWLIENPSDALVLVPQKLYRSWTITYADEQRAGPESSALFLLNVGFGFLVVAGFIVVWRGYREVIWLLGAPITAWLMKTILFYGSARQTAIVLPILVMLAAVAIDAGRVHLKNRLNRSRPSIS